MKKKPNGPDLISEMQSCMTDQEKDQLFAHVLRRGQVFDEAIARMPLSALRHQDDKYRILLNACHKLAKKSKARPGVKKFKSLLKQEVRRIGQDHDKDDPVFEAVEELASEGGFIDEAFNMDKADLSDDLGRSLLGRLLYEVDLVEPLYTLLATCRTNEQVPANLADVLDKLLERARKQESIDAKNVKTFQEEWEEHETRLKHYRGRKMVGIKTGLTELDRRTLGLRGLFIFGAKPGAGKTTYAAVAVAIGVCRNHEENDCVVIVLSLDMDRFELYRRIHCNIGDIEWKPLMFGSPEKTREPGSMFSKADQKRLKQAKQRLKNEEVGSRLAIVDRLLLAEDVTRHRLSSIIEEQKAKVGAKRALVIIDYLQLIPVPDEVAASGDLAADKYRVRLVQQVIEGSRTATDPLGDTALVISEARKPPTSKEKDSWGDSMSELMGSARLGYAADAVLLYREMNKKEMEVCYGVSDKTADERRAALAEQGIAPVTLILEKGRDGMIRGKWGVEFHFNKSVFTELPPKAHLLASCPLKDEEADDEKTPPSNGHLPLPPPPSGFQAKVKKKAKGKSSGSVPTDKGAPKKTSSGDKESVSKNGTNAATVGKKSK